MLEEVRDLADYKHHAIMQKLVIKKFQPAGVVQDLSKLVQIVNFDKIHSEGVNCIDMDPYGKILVSGSNDGFLKFLDLETMTTIDELVFKPSEHGKIKSVCIDDKHNVAFVDD
jgi:WD40 repeat protein